MTATHEGPWLQGLDRDLDELCAELLLFLARPAFGSRSKREVELEVTRLLYEHRLDRITVGQVADELAISRSKARGYLQEVRARQVADQTPAARQKMLFDAVVHWPLRGQLEEDKSTERLRVVVEDAYLRDLLKTHAYKQGSIVLDASFSSEIITLSWPAYERLLESLIDPVQADEVMDLLAADVRGALAEDDRRRKAFDKAYRELTKEDRTATEKALAAAKLVVEHLPTMVKAGGAVAAL